MIVDALGNEIEIGKSYGYILKTKWETSSIHGIAEKAKDGRVTLGSIHIRDIDEQIVATCANTKFKKEDRRRSVNSAFLFPINL